MTGAAIRCDGLSRSYASGGATAVALRDATFEVRPGEMLALLGPSGSGKSTLLSLLACADRPTSGRLAIAGTHVEALPDRALRRIRRRDLGTVFQQLHLLDGLTVRENVELPLVLLGHRRRAVRARVDEVLERVGVGDLGDRRGATLSGGQAQRVAIARAIVHAPAIVLADEPTSNLDASTGDAIARLLREIASAGQTLVVATHAAHLAALCDRSLHLRDGTLSR